jgi:hypothetical protein
MKHVCRKADRYKGKEERVAPTAGKAQLDSWVV